jgi:MFS family permease
MKNNELDGTASAGAAGEAEGLQGYKVYSYRWVVLAVYGIATAVVQLMWTTFFSITTVSWRYYGFAGAAAGENAISLLSIIFMVGMIVLSLPSLSCYERFGFKKSVGFGVVLTGLCALLRGIFGESYGMVLASTVGFAIAQPFILNAPGLVAGKWFPERERATANGVGLLCSYLGMCAGLLLTPVLIDGGMDIKSMLMAYGVVGAAAAVLFVALAREKPATPPCPAGLAERSDFRKGLKDAFRKRDFVLCIIVFFCMLGVFNTFFTMIEPILRQLSKGAVDATQAGVIGVVILGTGIASSCILSLVSDKDRLHRRRPYMIACNLVGTLGFGIILFATSFGGMVAAAVFYGFFIVGSAPLVLTFAAESAYPTSEGTTEGLLMFAGNVAGVVFLGGAALFGGDHYGLMVALLAINVVSIVLMLLSRETKLAQKRA